MNGAIIGIKATDQKGGLTLSELAAFVQAALKADIPYESVVRVRIGWSQQVQQITVQANPKPSHEHKASCFGPVGELQCEFMP